MILKGKIGMVTGGARGIGKETANILAREGAKVIVADIDEKGLEETADDIGDDAVFDFHEWVFTDVGALRERAGVSGSNQVAVAFAKDIHAHPLRGLEGFTQSGDDGAVAVCNRAGADTLAHEIGHLILHKKNLFVDKVVRIDFRNSTSGLAIDKEEIAANAFAAELLMPREFIRAEIKKQLSKKQADSLSKEELIEDLAKVFKVSVQAMEYRLNNLGILITQ